MNEFQKSLQVKQSKSIKSNSNTKFYKIYEKNREGKKIYKGRTI